MKIKSKFSNRSIFSMMAIIILSLFIYQFALYIKLGFIEIFSLWKQDLTIYHLKLVWFPIVSCSFLLVLNCLFINIFKPLKPYDEFGLMWHSVEFLSEGFEVAFLTGWIGCAIGIIISMFTCNIIQGFLIGFIWGFIVGLVFIFIACLIEGYKNEF